MSFWIQYPDLLFEEEKHEYSWKGRTDYPSVTELFDCVGTRKKQTKKNEYRKFRPLGIPDECKKEEHSIFGRAFHKIVNIIFLGKEVQIDDPEKKKLVDPWINQIKIFKEENNIVPLYDRNGTLIADYPMFSEFFKFFGSPDFFGRLGKTGQLILADWKSSSSYLKTYSWQTAGYEILVRELFGGKLFDKNEKILRNTVCFNPEYEREKGHPRNNPEDFIAFQSILNTYKLDV